MEQAAAVGAALEAEAGVLRERLSELAGMQQEFGALRSAHEAAAARVACLEAEGRELSAKAEALAAATSELAELRGQHADLQESSAALQQQLEAAQQELADTRCVAGARAAATAAATADRKSPTADASARAPSATQGRRQHECKPAARPAGAAERD